LLFLIPSGSTKTASDKNKKSENTPPQTSKQATNEPRRKRGFFFVVADPAHCNPARALRVKSCKGQMAGGIPMKLAAFVVVGFIAFAAAADGNNISSVNGSVKGEPGQTYGKLSAVNGNVRVGRGAIADIAKTVNGEITVEPDARLGEVSTVNGSLDIAEGASVERTASTVNGEVEIGNRARVGGDVSTVSGEIELKGAEVGGSLITINGDIELADGAHVRGGIHVKKKGTNNNWGWGKDEPVQVHICGTCVVDGELKFDRPVELRVDQGAKIGRVSGDSVTRR
jgi:hypothetical protein